MHFMHLGISFRFSKIFWGFSKLVEFLWNFWDGLYENGSKSSCITSYLHYSNVSCIIGVCLLCWTNCVLVGLDWAEPLMFLILYITCSCIFMHTYLTFSISLHIDCVWCFSMCFSLPLSLSLVYVSWVMAPKRRSTPSQNHFCSRASTSSDPTPSHVQFHDNKARQDFLENFSRQGIHSECQVIFLDFSNTNLPTIIHNRGWESLCDILVTYPSMLI